MDVFRVYTNHGTIDLKSNATMAAGKATAVFMDFSFLLIQPAPLTFQDLEDICCDEAIQSKKTRIAHLWMAASDLATFEANAGIVPDGLSNPPPRIQSKCACGSAAIGSPKHSSWCPASTR